ncbi:IclR family transcriptional regulator [Cryptosporangium phraense]|uniref:Glycerol operon regulatory protein n=1 Tax=Cryptosporangium phraense TaxID=2593070 RepID=A0A545B123_9ACTN|nr:IclR family transcriptional regulator [Cryptosporangium phraense]TQS46535.1 IclR family transcriptional regulator [Cryptosporangium phraense]
MDTAASVTSKALGILAAFSADAPRLTLSEIARRAGLPLTTAHRLVGELAEWGALERDETGRYRIGLRLWEVASLAPRSLGLRERAMPFLEDLYEVTHENVQLAVRDGHEAVYVERISGRQAIGVVSRVGGRLPLHATGVGQVLLAYSTPELQDRVLEQPLKAFTKYTLTDPKRLRQVLAEVRRAGIAVCDRMVDPDSLSVAAPVFGPPDGADAVAARVSVGATVVAALSVVVPSDGADRLGLVPAVRAAARGITRVLGGVSPPR